MSLPAGHWSVDGNVAAHLGVTQRVALVLGETPDAPKALACGSLDSGGKIPASFQYLKVSTWKRSKPWSVWSQKGRLKEWMATLGRPICGVQRRFSTVQGSQSRSGQFQELVSVQRVEMLTHRLNSSDVFENVEEVTNSFVSWEGKGSWERLPKWTFESSPLVISLRA